MKIKASIIILNILIVIISITMFILLYFYVIGPKSIPTSSIAKDCNIEQVKLQERTVFIVRPKDGVKNDKVIMYFHGGSYVAELSKTQWSFVKDISEDTKSLIIIPDYPLTPKYKYEDTIEFSENVYKKVIEKVDTKNLILIGDSAGGGLTLSLCQKMANDNIQTPEQILLISPWLDLNLDNPKIDKVQKKDKKLNKDVLKLAGMTYAGEDNIDSYLASPIKGQLKGLKNITVYTGTNDILNPDTHKLVEKAESEGSNVELLEEKGKEHIWFIDNEENRKEENAYKDLINKILK